MKRFAYFATAFAAIALGGCAVHQSDTPALSGPSELAISLTMNTVPDTISQDGGSQSSVKVTAKGPDGKALTALPLRVEMRAPDASGTMVPQDFGTLSARTIVTGNDGVATVIYTAPPSPVGGVTGTCSGLTGTCVEIVAIPTATNFGTVNPVTATIRLVPPGVILPPAGTPTASFTMTPTPVSQGSAVTFDASASAPGAGATQISSFTWTFGDGSTGSGKTVTHTFTTAATFNVTLSVTNDRNLSASSSQAVVVGAVAGPRTDFVFSPTSPAAGQTVFFNADVTTASSGHSISSFSWNFGDGATATGVVVSHVFANAGTYNVALSATDDIGQKTTTTKAVTVNSVGGGGGSAAPSVDFVFSPASPQVNQTIVFDASASHAAAGHTITKYSWTFGDSTTPVDLTGPTAQHAYSAAASYSVVLIATDDSGQTASSTKTVTVVAGAGSLSADFTMSPTNPVSGALVSFNANTSSPLSTITRFDWDFGDGTIIPNGGVSINHTYNTPVAATYTIRLTVTDNSGRTATTTKTLAVTGGTDPTAQFTISPNPTTVGTSVTFDGSSSIAGAGAITTYQWNFGDGSAIASGNPQTHSYAATGTYTITLTVTQTNGRTNSTSHTLLVQ